KPVAVPGCVAGTVTPGPVGSGTPSGVSAPGVAPDGTGVTPDKPPLFAPSEDCIGTVIGTVEPHATSTSAAARISANRRIKAPPLDESRLILVPAGCHDLVTR